MCVCVCVSVCVCVCVCGVCVSVCVCVCVCVCDLGLAVWLLVKCVACNNCHCLFPLEVSQHGCSLYFVVYILS